MRTSIFTWPVSLAIMASFASSVLLACGTRQSGGFEGDDTGSSSSASGADDSTVSSSNGSSSGSSSGSPSGSSSGSGTGSSSGSSSSGSSSGSSSTGSSSGATGPRDAGTDHYVPTCGRPCDLRSNTCCLPADGGVDASFCLSGTSPSCGTNIATLHCGGVTDCPSGQLCCGNYNLTAKTAETICQTVTKCSVAQFCETNQECPTGVQCTSQNCAGGNLYLCGLQAEAPYNCKPN